MCTHPSSHHEFGTTLFMFSSSSENGVKIPLATLVSVKVNSPAYAMLCGVELRHCNERQALRLAGSLLLPELIQTISIVIPSIGIKGCADGQGKKDNIHEKK